MGISGSCITVAPLNIARTKILLSKNMFAYQNQGHIQIFNSMD